MIAPSKLTNIRAWGAFFHDALAGALAFPLAYGLRLGFDQLESVARQPPLLLTWLVFALITTGVVYSSNLHRGIWRYASIRDLKTILKVASLITLLFLLASFLVTRLEDLPRSLPILLWIILVGLWAGNRILYRLFRDGLRETLKLWEGGFERGKMRASQIPVLLYGDLTPINGFLRRLDGEHVSLYRPSGIISSDKNQQGRILNGVPVLGDLKTVEKLLAEQNIDPRPERIIVALNKADKQAIDDLSRMAERQSLPLSRLPDVSGGLETGVDDDLIKVPPIAIEDLLGRAQTPLDPAPIEAMIKGKSVLVTGAGGSIGGQLVRQIAQLEPARLILLDNSEYALYLIDLELSENHPALARQAVLADVVDKISIARIFADYCPDLVFHAAALKHVPLVEANPLSGLRVNILGSRVIADACAEANARLMVQISTDKAVNPTSIMGAGKRLAEQYVQSLDQNCRKSGGPRFLTVRFGNVLGSTGSVIPLFERQLRQGGPLTVTHPDMRRYFMTKQEAALLVLSAAEAGLRDERTAGGVFVLDMGEQVKIHDLARRMIQLAGLRPDHDIKIEMTGLRPGEKLYEEPLAMQDKPLPDPQPGLTIAHPPTRKITDVAADIDRLAALIAKQEAGPVLDLLKELVPDYTPTTVS